MVTIKVARDSEFSQRIRAARASGEPILIDDGEDAISLYPATPAQPEPKADIWANYDPNAVMAALEQATGIFDGIDIEQLKADLREQRGHCGCERLQ